MGRWRKRTRQRTKRTGRGIFCLEGQWSDTIKKDSSVQPVLDLLQHYDSDLEIPYVHRHAPTRDALLFYLRMWTQGRMRGYPILYLAFHGSEGTVYLQRLAETNIMQDEVNLDQIEEWLADQCRSRVLFFAGCKTVDVHGNRLRGMLNATGARAICGYRADVGWLQATVFETIVLACLQQPKFSPAIISRRIKREAGSLARTLKFKMVW